TLYTPVDIIGEPIALVTTATLRIVWLVGATAIVATAVLPTQPIVWLVVATATSAVSTTVVISDVVAESHAIRAQAHYRRHPSNIEFGRTSRPIRGWYSCV